MFQRTYADVFTGDDTWRALPVPEGELFAWDRRRRTCGSRRTSTACRASRDRSRTSSARAASSCSATRSRPTTSRPRARSSRTRPAGKYLVEHGVERKDFNSYGSRRGNHEVMVRGTFANVRLRNQLVPGSEGTWTVHVPSGEEMTIFDASQRYLAEGTPLVVIAGKEYGSGSSRDWAAKGPKLLGVRAVIAESYERIHRSNLLMMGILPLQFLDGENRGVARPHRPRGVLDHGRRQRQRERGLGSGRRKEVPSARAPRHAARARVPAARRHPPVRAAAAARELEASNSAEARSPRGVPGASRRSCST